MNWWTENIRAVIGDPVYINNPQRGQYLDYVEPEQLAINKETAIYQGEERRDGVTYKILVGYTSIADVGAPTGYTLTEAPK